MSLNKVAKDLVLLFGPPGRSFLTLVSEKEKACMALDHRLLHVLADYAPGGLAVLLDE